MALVTSLVFATCCFLHPVSHFSTVNFTEGPNVMGFLPPQLPHMLFHYNSVFHSSFFLQHNHPFGYWLLFSFHTFPWVPAHPLGVQRQSSSKILSLLCGIWALPFLPVCKKWFSRRASAGVDQWNSIALRWSCSGVYQQKTWWPLASACFFSY